ncbi:hypothetical protein GCM10010423_37830 [Streptomyces levis]|uniref:Uncharacterized protein n=1 Tax=Streptomyces levis TaxID=285566 RepID=A0ABN3NZH0_9ACTN
MSVGWCPRPPERQGAAGRAMERRRNAVVGVGEAALTKSGTGGSAGVAWLEKRARKS